MAAGMDKTVRLFSINSQSHSTHRNNHFTHQHHNKLQSIFLQDMPIMSASFINNGSEIFTTGRRKFCYSIDIETGSVSKNLSRGISGMNLDDNEDIVEDKSWECHVTSPSSSNIILLGNRGTMTIVDSRHKQVVGKLRMSGSVRSACFGPRSSYESKGISNRNVNQDDDTLYSVGSDGDIYEWDMRMRKCLMKKKDNSGRNLGAIAVSKDSSFIVTGGDSGVVNVYSSNSFSSSILSSSSSSSSRINILSSLKSSLVPLIPLKTINSLTTPIDNLLINSSSELLCSYSGRIKDSLSLFHLPSLTTLSNWPSSSTPLHYVTAVDFSPNSGFFAVANDRGRVLLYRLKHYRNF